MWGRTERPLDHWIAARIGKREPLSRKDIEVAQIAALRETLAYVKAHSAYYAETLKTVEPAAICDLADLSRLPLTEADALRRNPEAFICVSPGKIQRMTSLLTSGSSGPPKRIAVTAADIEQTIDYFHNGMLLLADATDTVLNLFPAARPDSLGDLLRRAIRRIPCTVSDIDEFPPLSDAVARQIGARSATVLTGPPGLIAEVAAACLRGRIGQPIGSVLLSADYVSREAIRQIKQAWPTCKIFEHYGMTEMGFGCAVACGHGRGGHVRESDMILEIIDPQTLLPVPNGQRGEIVYTSLNRQGTPLVRYRTGDISRWLPSRCSCGSILRRLGKVGRRAVPKGDRQTAEHRAESMRKMKM